MVSTNISQDSESASLVSSLQSPAPAPLGPSFKKQATTCFRRRQSLADRRAHRPNSITIPPPSPLPSELSTIKLERLAEIACCISNRFPFGVKKPKDPRILLHTKTFRWVKMKDGVWVKVKRRGITIVIGK